MSRRALLALPIIAACLLALWILLHPGEGSGPNQSRRSIRAGLQPVPAWHSAV